MNQCGPKSVANVSNRRWAQWVDATPSTVTWTKKGVVYGTNRTTRALRWAENRVLGAVQRRAVDERHRTRTRPGSIVDSLRGALLWRGCSRDASPLTLVEREDISRGIVGGCSIRSIAERLGRAASTISREVLRHGGRCGYRATVADVDAWEAALRPKPCLLGINRKL